MKLHREDLILIMKLTALLILAAAFGIAHAEPLPVVPVTIKQICTPGYSATVRPSASFIRGVKRMLAEREGIFMQDVVVDHRVPIALGGSPRDGRNLRLLTPTDNRRKATTEVRLLRAVCKCGMPLEEAQRRAWDWKITDTHLPLKCDYRK